MSKRVRHDLTYDASAADVLAMLHDPAFREQVCEATGCLRWDVSVEDTSAGTLVTIDQVQPATGIPGFAKKFVGDEINIVQKETWNGDTAAVEVTIPGKPGQMTGTAALSESGGTTTERVDLEIQVGIPLVGGKIEGLIGDMLLKALKAENATGRAYLSA
jgi:hypothetical protein